MIVAATQWYVTECGTSSWMCSFGYKLGNQSCRRYILDLRVNSLKLSNFQTG